MEKSKKVKERGERIRYYREHCGLSRSEFASFVDTLNEHTLKSYEIGAREISYNKTTEIIEALQLWGIFLSVELLYYGQEVPPPGEREEIINENKNIQKEIMFFKNNNPRSILFKVPDSLMSPLFNKGDMVGGHKIRFKEQFDSVIGLNCIVQTLDGKQYLRKITNCEGSRVTCNTLAGEGIKNTPRVEDIEIYFVAHATRHWRLSELAQPVTDLLPMIDRPLIPAKED